MRITTFLWVPAIALIDQALKKWILTGVTLDTPFLKIETHFNSGILGGFLSQLDPWISRIFFSVLFAFLFLFTVVVLQLLASKNTPKLKTGLLLYLSGILGNVWDRVYTGKIVDFILLPFGPLEQFAFNFADIVLAVGFVFIVISLVLEFHQIWQKNNLRKNLLVDPSFQWSLTSYFVAIALGNFLVLATYSFSFIRIYLQPDFALSTQGADIVSNGFIFGMLGLEFFFLVTLVGFGLYYSHRIAGPVFIFQKRMRLLLSQQKLEASKEQDPQALKLRTLDYFKSLEELSKDLEAQLKSGRKTDA
jgi:signal peptidase II